jgi:hypothetical protein
VIRGTDKVSIKTSNIKDAGMGAFCSSDILKGQCLGCYEVCVSDLNYIYKIDL